MSSHLKINVALNYLKRRKKAGRKGVREEGGGEGLLQKSVIF
jgi:hypothetical protein